MKPKSRTIESFDKKARDQGQNDSDSDTIRTPKSTIHLKQVSSFYIFLFIMIFWVMTKLLDF